MSIIGISSEWSDLIDSKLPEILNLVVSSWADLPSPASDETEDNITTALCRKLMQNRTARGMMFQIRTQVVELGPIPGEVSGDLILRLFHWCLVRTFISVWKVNA